MIVIADTSPLNYLILIQHVGALASLYPRIFVPEAVTRELKREHTPAVVQDWIAQPPVWLKVRPDPPLDPTLALLDPGERAGRSEAERRNLRVTGTMGILAEAHLRGLLDFDAALARLRATNFRLSANVEYLVRRRLSAQQRKP